MPRNFYLSSIVHFLGRRLYKKGSIFNDFPPAIATAFTTRWEKEGNFKRKREQAKMKSGNQPLSCNLRGTFTVLCVYFTWIDLNRVPTEQCRESRVGQSPLNERTAQPDFLCALFRCAGCYFLAVAFSHEGHEEFLQISFINGGSQFWSKSSNLG